MITIRPSGAPRWVPCPGSIQAESGYKNEETESARVGTAAHWVASEVLTSHLPASESVVVAEQFSGKTAPNGVFITQEMIDSAYEYIIDVLTICGEYEGLALLKIEQKVQIERVHHLNEGTPDAHLFSPDRMRLIVWDFKNGRAIVEPYRNWQLIDYTAGVLYNIASEFGYKMSDIKVELRIVQPMAYHPDGNARSWVVNGEELVPYIERLKKSAVASQQEFPPTKAGKHCKYCLARGDCQTLKNHLYESFEHLETLRLKTIANEHLSTEINFLGSLVMLATARKESLESQAMVLIESGNVIPGKELGYGRGSTIWTKTLDEVSILGAMLNKKFTKEPVLITPKQAIKLGVDEAVINQYSKYVRGKIKLNDVTGHQVSNVFKKNRRDKNQ